MLSRWKIVYQNPLEHPQYYLYFLRPNKIHFARIFFNEIGNYSIVYTHKNISHLVPFLQYQAGLKKKKKKRTNSSPLGSNSKPPQNQILKTFSSVTDDYVCCN